jgi:primosomal protein N' (replication factor Y) (superfamily II helicase)
MIAEVIPGIKTFSGTESFSYEIPKELEPIISIGSLVLVPLGKQHIQGVVTRLTKNRKTTYKLKPLKSVDTNVVISSKFMEIAKWVASYYLCSFGEALSLFLPPLMKKPKNDSGVSSDISIAKEKIVLSAEQREVFDNLNTSLNIDHKKPVLLKGITGSGKTEIYIKLAQKVISQGNQVIVLIPEIVLTPQIVERFERYFDDKIAIMHSSLSKSERYHCYQDYYQGKKKIIIGPRSALLVPSENTKLIIIDEEQEDSYKQDRSPRYDARVLAEKMAKSLDALLIYGTATPTIERYHKAMVHQYDFFEIKTRYFKQLLPKTTVVDLKKEIQAKNYSTISTLLQKEMAEVLNQKKQILLFLNRRGNATFVSCRDCGHVMLCRDCSIPLVFHTDKKDGYLSCHHCNHTEASPAFCPKCNSSKIKFFGAGIEKIELDVRRLFPEARVVRVDSKTMTTKNAYDKFYQDLKNHRIDIVIGTQIIAKGLDIPNVDLVGIVSADTGLHLPHFKAGEKTFQIITQVSGRSGRKDSVGKTIIQTFWPDSIPIRAAIDHDYSKFYDYEINERKKYCYPPFCRLIRIISEDKDEKKAFDQISRIQSELDVLKIDFIGPGKCFYQKLYGKYRYHIIVKTDKILDEMLLISKDYPDIIIDVDPISLL